MPGVLDDLRSRRQSMLDEMTTLSKANSLDAEQRNFADAFGEGGVIHGSACQKRKVARAGDLESVA